MTKTIVSFYHERWTLKGWNTRAHAIKAKIVKELAFFDLEELARKELKKEFKLSMNVLN